MDEAKKMPKQKIVNLLRKLHLLPLADKFKFLAELKNSYKANQTFSDQRPDFAVPPASIAYDAYGHTNWQQYFTTGKNQAQYLSELIKKYAPAAPDKIAEWGCGAARILRHMPSFFPEVKTDFWGFDYNPTTIKWCSETFDSIHFSKNLLAPPLPCPDNQFDCLFCVSVFTHLSEEMHYEWIAEISRVVKPGGLIIFTTHGNHNVQNLLAAEKQKYDEGNLVVRGNIKEGKRCFTAHHPLHSSRIN